jgi:hypothetical protein
MPCLKDEVKDEMKKEPFTKPARCYSPPQPKLLSGYHLGSN